MAHEQPHLFTGADPASGDKVLSCTIIVSGVSAWMRPYHDRIPVLLAAKVFDAGWPARLVRMRSGRRPNARCAKGRYPSGSTAPEPATTMRRRSTPSRTDIMGTRRQSDNFGWAPRQDAAALNATPGV